jgi:anti-sigma-K factor RskA
MLALAAPRAEPPAGLERRVFAEVRATGRAASPRPAAPFLRSPRFLAVAAAACFIAAVALAAANLALARDLRGLATRAIPETPVVVVMSGTPFAPAASAVLIVGADSRHGTLAVKNLAVLEADRQYQLWLIRDGARTSGGVFSVDAAGDGTLLISAPRPLDGYLSFGVTIEPAGGSQGPTGAKVLGGVL